jgi:hypothetical protein
MGQYHKVVNLDKLQMIDPHKLGAGLKLWEQLATHPGTGAALVVLLASASNGQGGGDLRTESSITGHWRGDRIAFVGDYDDDSRYHVNGQEMSGRDIYDDEWTDVTDQVCAVIEAELAGKFSGGGWRTWTPNEED